MRKKAVIIGSGIGGLSLGIRLQSLGFDTTMVEALDKPWWSCVRTESRWIRI